LPEIRSEDELLEFESGQDHQSAELGEVILSALRGARKGIILQKH
jgi:hypothetical protein